MFVKSSRYCREKNCVKAWEFNFLSATVFCMAAILAAILKNKFDENVREVGKILKKKNCVKIQEFHFLSSTIFCMAAILAAILKKKVHEDVRGVGQIL